MRRRWWISLVLGGLLAGGLAHMGRTVGGRAASNIPDYRAACLSDNPYFVTACHPNQHQARQMTQSIVMFHDMPGNSTATVLADQATVGSVWGLAYSSHEDAVYAAAFHRRGLAFGPGGPGAIYRIDLATSAVTTFAMVPNAGPDRHTRDITDLGGRYWAGKTSLGDLDLSSDGSELYVTNLNDRRIYRFEVPTARLLGSFDSGAAAAAWANEARPFGLKYAAGRLYHGLVRTAEQSRRLADLAGYVFSSRPDGSDMRELARIDLDYPRGDVLVPVNKCPPGPSCWYTDATLSWKPWVDGYRSLEPEAAFAVYPMPILADIEIDGQGRAVIGLRDRQGDVTSLPGSYFPDEDPGIGVGDVLRGVVDDGGWQFDPLLPHYDDSRRWSAHSALGGLAQSLVLSQLVIVSLGEGRNYWAQFPPAPNGGAVWLDNATGNKLREEPVCAEPPGAGVWPLAGLGPPVVLAHNEGMAASHLGDIEELCGLLPTPTPTDTAAPSPTPTVGATRTVTNTPSATPRSTATAATATRTATPSPTAAPVPVLLPLLLKEDCRPGAQPGDVVLVIDTSSSMAELTSANRPKIDAARSAAGGFLDRVHLEASDQAAIVWFNEEAALEQPLTSQRALLDDALRRLVLRQFTRIDLGIALAREELAGPRHRPQHTPVMIVLTDGRANPVPVDVAVREARQAKDAGVLVFTIGLGSDLDAKALEEMASRPEWFYAAPDAEKLTDIYRSIAVEIPCPKIQYWGRR